jgi:hypothetical protein
MGTVTIYYIGIIIEMHVSYNNKWLLSPFFCPGLCRVGLRTRQPRPVRDPDNEPQKTPVSGHSPKRWQQESPPDVSRDHSNDGAMLHV